MVEPKKRSAAKKRRNREDLLREAALFVIGAGGVVYEAAARTGEPRWALLLVYASMLGLTVFMENGRRKRANGG